MHKTYIRPKLNMSWRCWVHFTYRVLKKYKEGYLKCQSPWGNYPKVELPRRLRVDLIEAFQIINGHYKCDLNIFNFAYLQLRGHDKKLTKERCTKLLRRNFLSNRVVYKWNRLSQDTVNSPLINAFKNRLYR